jgi:uncharacterized membrane protein
MSRLGIVLCLLLAVFVAGLVLNFVFVFVGVGIGVWGGD